MNRHTRADSCLGVLFCCCRVRPRKIVTVFPGTPGRGPDSIRKTWSPTTRFVSASGAAMQGMECFFIFFVILAVVIGVAVYNQTVTQPKLNEAWQTAARELLFQFTPGDWLRSRSLTGGCRGQAVTVDVYRTGGKNSQ